MADSKFPPLDDETLARVREEVLNNLRAADQRELEQIRRRISGEKPDAKARFPFKPD